MRILLVILTLLIVAACGTQNPPAIPTLALLPTDTEPPLETPPDETSTGQVTPTDAPLPSPTEPPTVTEPPTATEPPTLTSTPQPTLTDTPQPTVTFTPSLTITNTVTPPPTATFTATLALSGMGMLADLAARTTILPPEQLYNPGTLTAVADAALTQSAISASALTPTMAAVEAGDVGGLLPFSTLGPATFPPTPITCTFPPPAGLSALFAADPGLLNSLGCPSSSAPASNTTAVQVFERGLMVYIAGTPGSIYVLMNDGRFRRFDDTWVQGVDPDSAGMSPPPGLLEPIRGFGKVWRENLDVQSALGWGVTQESGDTSSIQLFERGRAVALPQRGETVILVDDLGAQSGTWRANPGGL